MENYSHTPEDAPRATEEDINNIINTATRLCGHAVISLLCEYDMKYKELIADAPWGYMQLALEETTDKLNINLVKVNKEYRCSVAIPRGYEKALFEKYNMIKSLAVTYWAYLLIIHPELTGELKALAPDTDFSSLKVDNDNPTTLYFDKEYPKRLGIYCCYMDADGKTFDYEVKQ